MTRVCDIARRKAPEDHIEYSAAGLQRRGKLDATDERPEDPFDHEIAEPQTVDLESGLPTAEGVGENNV
jgi:hypothetical protein